MTTASPSKRRISPWWGLLIVPVILVALPATGIVKPPSGGPNAQAAKLETAAATQGVFRVGVSGSGTLKAANSFDVKPQISGTVQRLPTEGDRVTRGQLVARLDPTSFQRSVENAQLALDKALAQLESTRAAQANNRGNQQQTIASTQASLASAQVEANNARISLENQRKLFAVGGVSAQDVRNAQSALEKANAMLESARVAAQTARNAVGLKADSDTQDLRNLQLAVDQARVQLRNAQTDLARTKIYAPVAGVVSSVPAQVGGPATSQAALFTVINDASIELPVQVDETEIGGVKVGQKAIVTLDALTGETFNGKVKRISPKAEVVQNIAVFYVTVTLENASRKLRPGMTGEAEIVAREITGAVQVPKRALQEVEGRTYVSVLDSATQKQELRRVKLGPDDGSVMVIEDGLQPGETVVLPSRTAPPSQGPLP